MEIIFWSLKELFKVPFFLVKFQASEPLFWLEPDFDFSSQIFNVKFWSRFSLNIQTVNIFDFLSLLVNLIDGINF